MSVAFADELLLTSSETLALIDALAARLHADRLGLPDPQARVGDWVVIGIRRGGALVAERLWDRLCERVQEKIPIGFLDITFYRDDLDTIGPNPVVGETDLRMDIDHKHILLVDDVLFTGRTIRAAMNALFDYGRPERVELLVLVDRGGRQLPIQPDHVGLVVQAGMGECIKLVDKGENVQVVRRKLG
ncbi:bifunctional pyr operon transcriptional regulator/uracil phosphoribosyltransferase PyrR [Candidatus Magnetaquicoccus inordinatus]|uniref:bifunctional pyr operon transcriptional regulator/uracil phosphoribosyltransferase PyrR n=1 Tax=Candidatus Magnetaquicoccus inordinatus TaxID=2496818 RepID=UPI00102C9B4E|nr:bifunctional pyr operon transcriptional regulator/uracil phosphoribosyltransferase PyrR [Candidatus Magnetaquicoccus inordinatus]